MAESLRLMCILAHPDDESLGMAGTLAKYAAEGVAVHLITATRGERGWPMERGDYPGPAALGRRREDELRKAAAILGIREVAFLDYMDGDLDQAPVAEAIARIVRHLRQARPQVVVTFSPDGAYGHPDHIAISQFTQAAVVCAADATYGDGLPPHRVQKLYYKVWTREELSLYEARVGDIGIDVDGERRRQVSWETWAISTWVDADAHWETAWQAIACHASQLQTMEFLPNLSREELRQLWGGRQGYYRVYSSVNGGRQVEDDLFTGLRAAR